MMNYLKKGVSSLLATSLALSLVSTAKASGELEFLLEQQAFQSPAIELLTAESGLVGIEQTDTEDYDRFYQAYGDANKATVFYNGQQIGFKTAYPLIKDGTTFVPLAVFSNVIGSEIRYIQETHSVELVYKGNTITFDIGETGFSVNGETTQHLPNPTFVIDGNTMVPVRFITAAFELDLYWNGGFNQVIVADLDLLKETIHTDYTLMNGFLSFANGNQSGLNPQVSGSLNATVTVDGKDLLVNTQMDALAQRDGSVVQYAMDLAVDLADYQSEVEAMLGSLETEAEVAVLEALLTEMQSSTLSLICDLENLTVYFQCGLVEKLLPVALGVSFPTVNADTWFKLSLGDVMSEAEVSSLQAFLGEALNMEQISTMEDLVDTMMTLTTSYDNRYVNVYGGLETILNGLRDSLFNQEGSDYVAYALVDNGISRLNYVLSLGSDEEGTVNGYTLRLEQEERTGEKIEFSATQDREEALQFTLNVQSAGVELDMEGDFDVSYTEIQPDSAPSGGNILDVSQLFG